MKKTIRVWSEGYVITGNSSKAQFHGEVFADNLIDAAEKLGINLDKNPDGSYRLDEKGRPSVWACTIFDNEADARKSFG